MTEIQKKITGFTHKVSNPYLLPLLLFVVILISFVIFTPKVSSSLFPQKREVILQNFITETRKEGKINPQAYWEFREFYSPGFFKFSRAGLNKTTLSTLFKNWNISLQPTSTLFPFLLFTSPHLISVDNLTTNKTLAEIVDIKNIPTVQILFQNKDSLIFQSNDNIINIIFILSGNDMKMANGFFEYNDKDKKLTEGKNWFNVTQITKD